MSATGEATGAFAGHDRVGNAQMLFLVNGQTLGKGRS